MDQEGLERLDSRDGPPQPAQQHAGDYQQQRQDELGDQLVGTCGQVASAWSARPCLGPHLDMSSL